MVNFFAEILFLLNAKMTYIFFYAAKNIFRIFISLYNYFQSFPLPSHGKESKEEEEDKGKKEIEEEAPLVSTSEKSVTECGAFLFQ
ncbi:hypothetical protein A3D88_02680 [Candidatus Peribacteria bacterium RIFCSPHIGHO2_02_FULL_52_16]|nr:MAG: hypothetical protein A2706_00505 [Candidatus Peribacteria bacterium RIFCSPHIGHO2_01_FULL_51_35]OGJ61665.1 MAG: hypothetical protein A3D88_02680 [Candidatus Peribacteria bacterium RIFCSPHIGHO2_02_FULL_52_16]